MYVCMYGETISDVVVVVVVVVVLYPLSVSMVGVRGPMKKYCPCKY